MEVGEAVGLFTKALKEDEYCEGEKKTPPPDWESNINKWGGKCSGTKLYGEMKDKKEEARPFMGGPDSFVEKPGSGFSWSLNNCKPDRFPIQAHHLIPKNYLPGHGVCVFLAKAYSEDKKYQLEADTNYNCDHANNGYCLPYATPLSDWKQHRKLTDQGEKRSYQLTVAFEVIDITKRQLHQGSHKWDPYDDPEDMEEADLHDKEGSGKRWGYLETVAEFLSAVQQSAREHVKTCSKCKTKSGGKTLLQPLSNVVRHVDQASGLIKLMVDAKQIFVSEIAYLWWEEDAKKLAEPKWLKKLRGK